MDGTDLCISYPMRGLQLICSSIDIGKKHVLPSRSIIIAFFFPFCVPFFAPPLDGLPQKPNKPFQHEARDPMSGTVRKQDWSSPHQDRWLNTVIVYALTHKIAAVLSLLSLRRLGMRFLPSSSSSPFIKLFQPPYTQTFPTPAPNAEAVYMIYLSILLTDDISIFAAQWSPRGRPSGAADA